MQRARNGLHHVSVGIHFQPEALKFLRGLARHNDREWFEARRGTYEQHIKAPMLALIEEANASLIHFAPDHVRTPAKTMMRIYRDTRFSPDKRPYKKHVAAWFGRKGSVRTTGAGFYLHVSASEVHFGAGVFVPLPEQLLAIRQWMADNHASFEATLRRVTKPRKGGPVFEIAHANALARMPKGFPAEHPAGELLRARRWGVVCSGPSSAAIDEGFSNWLSASLEASAPVVSALDEAIVSTSAAVSKQLRRPVF